MGFRIWLSTCSKVRSELVGYALKRDFTTSLIRFSKVLNTPILRENLLNLL